MRMRLFITGGPSHGAQVALRYDPPQRPIRRAPPSLRDPRRPLPAALLPSLLEPRS